MKISIYYRLLLGRGMGIFVLCLLTATIAMGQQVPDIEPTTRVSKYLSKSNFTGELAVPARGKLAISDPNVQDWSFTSSAQVRKRQGEVKLVYTRVDQSDLSGTDWSYEILFNVVETGGAAVFDEAQSLVITHNDVAGVYEQVLRFELANNIAGFQLDIIDEVITGDVPEDIEVIAEIETAAYRAMEANMIDLEVEHTESTNPDGESVAYGAQLTWNHIDGAEKYEIEYVYLDAFEVILRDANGNIDYTCPTLFDRGIKIETWANWYDMEITYPAGYVLYRVRPVGRYLVEDNSRIGYHRDGSWSNIVETAVSDTGDIPPFESDKTWQFTTSFAEDGKRKKVFSYYDGSMRNRQVVTNLNDEEQVLVAETDYTLEGQGTLSILPAPAKPGDNTLFFKKDFNVNGSGMPYSFGDFDKGSGANALATDSGAGQYYSGQNIHDGIYNDLIPDAEGFPLTQSRFMRDGTGRLESQGGVGAFYQLGSEKETEYHHANATNTELFRLFGIDVGNAKHYKKEIVKDANGQLSYSYVDQAGQVVATALGGNTPDNVVALDDQNPQTIIQDLMGNNQILDLVSESSNAVFNPFLDGETNNASIEYGIFASNLGLELSNGADFCVDCLFELQIAVKDPNGDAVSLTAAEGEIQEDGSIIIDLDFLTGSSCPGGNDTGTTIDFPMNIQGTYLITKTLRTNNASREGILERLDDGVSLPDLDELIAEYESLIDPTQCEPELKCDLIQMGLTEELEIQPSGDAGLDAELVELDRLAEVADRNYPDRVFLRAEAWTNRGSPYNFRAAIGFDLSSIPSGTEIRSAKLSLYSYPLLTNPSIPPGHNQLTKSNRTELLRIMEPWDENTVTWNNQPATTEENKVYLEATSVPDQDFTDIDVTAMVQQMIDDETDGDGIIMKLVTEEYYAAMVFASSDSDDPARRPKLIIDYGKEETPPIYKRKDGKTVSMNDPEVIEFDCQVVDLTDIRDVINATCDGAVELMKRQTNPGFGGNTDIDRFIDWDTDEDNIMSQSFEIVDKDGVTYYWNGTTFVNSIDNSNTSSIEITSSERSVNATVTAGTFSSYLRDPAKAEYFQDQWAERLVIYHVEYCHLPYCYITSESQLFDYQLLQFDGEEFDETMAQVADFLETTVPSDVTGFVQALKETDPFFSTIIPDFGAGSTCDVEALFDQYSSSHLLTMNDINEWRGLIEDQGETAPENFDWILFRGSYQRTKAKVIQVCKSASGCAYQTDEFAIYREDPYIDVIDPTGSEQSDLLSEAQEGSTDVICDGQVDFVINWINAQLEICAEAQEQTAEVFDSLALEDQQRIIDLVQAQCAASFNPELGSMEGFQQEVENILVGAGFFTGCPDELAEVITSLEVITLDDIAAEPFELPFDVEENILACKDQLYEEARDAAQAEWERQVNELITEVLNAQGNCLDNANETFTVTYTESEYHHTLYYYSQAGDLIRTVPPIGIDGDFYDEVSQGNIPLTANAKPDHTQITEYDYNTLGQVVRQETPDAGETKFYYDEAQRLRLSQDAEQKFPTDDGSPELERYSYTKYDEQSRITEVGEVAGITEAQVSDLTLLNQLNWPTAADGTLVDQTITVYDDAALDSGIDQGLVRSRVSYTTNDHMSTYYSYDVHGNVRTLAHRINNLANTFGDQVIEYDYDLISGNVKEVAYQRGKVDQFYHRYDYDADNRLTHVYTSEDDVIWEQDARYFYYLHGPLARVEVGHDQVQGMDYYYTLQGWIKGVNLHTLDDPDMDPGMDGAPTLNANSLFARDEMAYMLGYHKDDYKAINNSDFTNKAEGLFTGSTAQHILGGAGLYNGNIATMATSIPTFDGNGVQIGHELQAMSYKYDQLHRIKEAKAHTFDGSNWALRTENGVESFASAYNYDGNGNLQNLSRNHLTGVKNNIRYEYNTDDNKPNQLKTTTDAQGSATASYLYDQIGNMIQGKGATNIEWDVYGKIESVDLENGGRTSYIYDPAGNRLCKASNTSTRYYIRDASGNIMATYNYNPSGLFQEEVSLYGSSRLGQRTYAIPDRKIGVSLEGAKASRNRGERYYEASNHLGNVLTVFSDQKNFDNATASYQASVKSASDYYPFGLEMNERSMVDASYRYGFNGKERDVDGIGDQTHYDYGFRIYNPEIARFLSVDPLSPQYPWYTPYQFAGNRPIDAIDLDGLEIYLVRNTIDDKGILKTEIQVLKDGLIKKQFGATKNGSRVEKRVLEINVDQNGVVISENTRNDLTPDEEKIIAAGVDDNFTLENDQGNPDTEKLFFGYDLTNTITKLGQEFEQQKFIGTFGDIDQFKDIEEWVEEEYFETIENTGKGNRSIPSKALKPGQVATHTSGRKFSTALSYDVWRMTRSAFQEVSPADAKTGVFFVGGNSDFVRATTTAIKNRFPDAKVVDNSSRIPGGNIQVAFVPDNPHRRVRKTRKVKVKRRVKTDSKRELIDP